MTALLDYILIKITDVSAVLAPAKLVSQPLNALHALPLDLHPILLEHAFLNVVMDSLLVQKPVILVMFTQMDAETVKSQQDGHAQDNLQFAGQTTQLLPQLLPLLLLQPTPPILQLFKSSTNLEM